MFLLNSPIPLTPLCNLMLFLSYTSLNVQLSCQLMQLLNETYYMSIALHVKGPFNGHSFIFIVFKNKKEVCTMHTSNINFIPFLYAIPTDTCMAFEHLSYFHTIIMQLH